MDVRVSLMKHSEEELIAEAEKARENAYAPYSNFKVGAAVESDNGDIYIGCNVESASYGLTVCAERVAIWKGISRGEKHFKRIAVVVDTEEPTPPCGTCRQIIWEFCGDVPVILANLHGKKEVVMMSELLPRAFDSKFLK
jgi:cytidine deaminase